MGERIGEHFYLPFESRALGPAVMAVSFFALGINPVIPDRSGPILPEVAFPPILRLFGYIPTIPGLPSVLEAPVGYLPPF